MDLLKNKGKLIIVHNSNKDFMGDLLEFSKEIFEDIEFDVFVDDVLKDRDYSVDYFNVDLKAKTYEELAELVQVLIIVPDELYYEKFDKIVEFLKKKLNKPEFKINQRILIVNK